jgi:UDP:flavonoid glycosyltransferase YjiC (YdhE family)
MAAKVLVAVLDWGLGHATRSAPVIDVLVVNGVNVLIASSGNALSYLKHRFPQIETLEMPSIKIRYGGSGAFYGLAMRSAVQPWLNRSQQQWICRIVGEHNIKGIISDNVYGAWHESIPCVIITHQLHLKVPFAKAFANRILNKWLRRFETIWVPDIPGEGSISGSLTANGLALNVQWLGILSRFNSEHFKNQAPRSTKKYSYTALLSGPEPQRSIFEREVQNLFAGLEGEKIIVQGHAQFAHHNSQHNNGITTIPFIDGDALADLLLQTEVVVCRSGYSTICDLVALNCKALLVPTPQQPEQIYLAEHCEDRGWFAYAEQGNITNNDLIKAKGSAYGYTIISLTEEIVSKFIGRL